MSTFEKIIQSKALSIHKIVDFDEAVDKVVPLDFTASNTALTDEILNNTDLFSNWINKQLDTNGARYGIGGYNEHRTIYARSAHFSGTNEPRRLHLGIDIWAPSAMSLS